MEADTDNNKAPAKPTLLRQVVPWFIALGILGYMFYEVDFSRVWEALENARVSWIIAAYLTYCAVYFFTDILSFFRTYNWFNVEIGFNETARLRFASYTVQAITGALTEIMTVLYMFRVKKVPVLHSTSSAGFIYFNETLTMIAFLSYCAFFLPEANRIQVIIPGADIAFWTLFQALIIVAWSILPAWFIFWRTGLRDRLPKVRDASMLMAFKEATLANYCEVFLYRFSNNFISILANIVMLRALGIEAPAALLFAVVPIMVNVAYWPVSAGGFGGTQLVAHFLLAGHASEEQVLAYSLVWSALFFLTRTLTGVGFIGPVYKAAFGKERG